MHGTGSEAAPSRGFPSDESLMATEAVKAAVRFWWISMLRGCLALLLGLGALVTGDASSTLVNFFAVYWVLGGVLTARWALGIRWKTGSRLGFAAGTLAIALGLALLARHALADVVSKEALISGVALTTIAAGCMRLVGAYEIEERTGHRWTFGGVLLGSVEVCLGIIVFLVRNGQASTVRITIGVWALVAGVLLLLQAARMLQARRGMTRADE